MKVILLERYKKLGALGDLVEVKNGFARNFLLPEGKAVQATKSNVEDFESRKAELVEISKKREEEAKKLSKKIEGTFVNVIKQAADDGRLYGSVSTSEIAKNLNEVAETDIAKKQIIVSFPIKSIGIYKNDIDLSEGITGNIFINVARSEGEAEEAIKKFNSGDVSLISSGESQEIAKSTEPTFEEENENSSDASETEDTTEANPSSSEEEQAKEA